MLAPCLLGEPKSVFQYPRPMTYAVSAVPTQRVIFKESMNNGLENQHYIAVDSLASISL